MKSRNKHLVVKFLHSFLIAFFIFIILATAAIFALLYTNNNTGNAMSNTRLEYDPKTEETESTGLITLKENINFVLLATDVDGTRTDTMMAGTFNSETGQIDIISLPRDSRIVMPEERVQILRDAGRWVPAGGVMKLNEVHAYAGRDRAIEFSVKQIEEILNIRIDYYVRLDLNAFRFIVDSIGGVEFDVPVRMNYTDPTPGYNLRIDLHPGLQLLDGATAEGLVRFRKNNDDTGYAEGDVTRARVQQDFIKATISQMMERGLWSNLPALIGTYLNYVDTNFGITDIPRFLPYINQIDVDNINMYILPGVDEYINGGWYRIIDQAATRDLVNQIFYNSGNEEIEEEDSFDKNIEILNGAGISGLAASHQEQLESIGYTISSIGDFTGTRRDYTRIVVRQRGHGADLQALYENSQIVIDNNLRSDIDIQIILGTDEN